MIELNESPYVSIFENFIWKKWHGKKLMIFREPLETKNTDLKI